MAASFLACVLSFWLLLYGIPVFLVGVILLWFSNQTRQTKRWLTFGPVIFYGPLTYLFLLAYNYSPPRTYLIPADYNGVLRLVYEQPCGTEPTQEDGHDVLTFPRSGILIVKTDFDKSLDNIQYVLVDAKGNRKAIRGVLDTKYRFSSRPVIIPLHSGSRAETSSDSEEDQKINRIVYTDFYLFNTDTTDYRSTRLDQKVDSLMDVALQGCRQKHDKRF